MAKYAVIMAGGSGTRFWPASREMRPKQLLTLLSDKTLIQETIDRVRPLFPLENILVVTGSHLEDAVRRACPQLPRQNVLLEPHARNTAPCIGFAASVIAGRDPHATIVVLPADHYIANEAEFRQVLADAMLYAAGGRMVTLGITPTSPSTAYGYLNFGDFGAELTGIQHRARDLLAFVEKPDLQTALSFLQQGRYLWNSGIFVFQVDQILSAIATHLPALSQSLGAIRAALGKPDESAIVAREFASMESISIDYGVMEKATRMLVIPSSFGWSDVGSWDALYGFAETDAHNFTLGPTLAIDSFNNVLYSNGPLIGTIDMVDTIVVATPDAVLVCPRSKSQRVKEMVGRLKLEGQGNLL